MYLFILFMYLCIFICVFIYFYLCIVYILFMYFIYFYLCILYISIYVFYIFLFMYFYLSILYIFICVFQRLPHSFFALWLALNLIIVWLCALSRSLDFNALHATPDVRDSPADHIGVVSITLAFVEMVPHPVLLSRVVGDAIIIF